ncbi:MAG: RICIN domain-containing protein [Bryobacteraceae bacterium]
MHPTNRNFSLAAAVLLAATSMSCLLRAQGGFAGPGRYEIGNLKSGRVLDLDRNDRTTVIQFSSRNTDNQQWDIRAAEPDYWFIRNAMTGAALEAMGDRNSTPVRGMPFTGGPSQQWRISPGKDGNALITNRLGKTLDIPDGTSRDGARVQTYDLNGDSNQRFLFRRVADLPRYQEDRPGPRDRPFDRPFDRPNRGDQPYAGIGRFDERDRLWKIDGDGVCFYRQDDFRGRGFCMRAGEEVRRVPDEWVNSIRSVRFFGRVRTVAIFSEPDFGGRRARITHDEPDLDRFRSERGDRLDWRIVSFRIF